MNIDWNLLLNSLELLALAWFVCDYSKTRKRVKELEKYQEKIFERINKLEKEQKNTPE